MKGLLWILVLFAAAVGVALMAHFNEGYVLLVLAPYRVEMSLNLVLFSIFGGFVLFYALLRGAALASSLPERIRKSRSQSQNEKAIDLFLDAFRLYFERRYEPALKCIDQINAGVKIDAEAALLGAGVSAAMHDIEKQKISLEKAVQKKPSLKMAALVQEAKLLINVGAYEKALVLLKSVQEISEHRDQHIVALQMELRAYQGLTQYDEVLRVTRALEGLEGVNHEEAEKIKLEAHLRNFIQKTGDSVLLETYYAGIPSHEESPDVIRAYTEALIQSHASDLAQRFIEKQLAKEWNPELIELYGKIPDGELDLRHLQMEKWKHEHGDEPAFLKAFARIYMKQNLTDKAIEALKQTLSIEDSADAKLMLIQLLVAKGEYEHISQYFKSGAEE